MFLPKDQQLWLSIGALTGLMLGLVSSPLIKVLSPIFFIPALLAGILITISILSKVRKDILNKQLQLLQIYQLASLGQQTTGLLHDLSNPLTGLNLSLYQLEQQQANPFLNQAVSCSQKIQQVIESNRVQFQNQFIDQCFNLKTTFEQAVDILHYPLVKENIRVIINISPQAELFGRQNSFRQIIINLLNNIIEAYQGQNTTDKTIQINLKVQPTHYYLTIRDQAGGINKSRLDKIFDPLFSNQTKTGLGLSLTKHMLKTDFKAQINVLNCPGQGSQFSLILPFNAEHKKSEQ